MPPTLIGASSFVVGSVQVEPMASPVGIHIELNQSASGTPNCGGSAGAPAGFDDLQLSLSTDGGAASGIHSVTAGGLAATLSLASGTPSQLQAISGTLSVADQATVCEEDSFDLVFAPVLPDGGLGASDAGLVRLEGAFTRSTCQAELDAGNRFPSGQSPLPLIPNNGGPILAAPRIVVVTFSTDTQASEEETYVRALAGSSYWSTLQQYGVGDVAAVTAVQLSGSQLHSTEDDNDDIQPFLEGAIGTSLPDADANTLYVIFYPSSVTVTLDGYSSCQAFGGYHSELPSGSLAPYAVIPQCPGFLAGATDLQEATGAASHEIAEGCTEPHPNTDRAWGEAYGGGPADYGDNAWAVVLGGGGEVGDMCAQNDDAFFVDPETGYVVQRLWSNGAAELGLDPCQPAANEVYVNAAPVLSSDVDVGPPFGTGEGLVLTSGQSASVDLRLFSSAPIAPWYLSAVDLGGYLTNNNELSFTFGDAGAPFATGNDGDVVRLNVTVDNQDTTYGYEQILLYSYRPGASPPLSYDIFTDGGISNLWPILIAPNP